MNEQSNVQSALLTVPEAARYLSVSEGSVRGLLKSGKLPEVRPLPDAVRIARSDLDTYIAGNRRMVEAVEA